MKEFKPYGLVIAGGLSNRMGSDKGWLRYHGKPQVYHVYDQLSSCCENVFISCNRSQKNRIFPYYHCLVDKRSFENTGPIAALMTAFHAYPGHDFLVAATDYPFLSTDTLQTFSKFAATEGFSAFFNCRENVYEPLLAFYPKEIVPALQAFFLEKKYSLQKFLIQQNAKKFIPADIHELTNVNTPEEFQAAYDHIHQQQLQPSPHSILSSHHH